MRAPALLALLLLPVLPAATARAGEDGTALFEAKIRPVLVQHCYKCHSATARKIKGDLLLDSRDGLRKGGESGPAIIPGEPDKSLLLKALRYQEHEMPPNGKLPDSVIADFAAWIKQGAVDPRVVPATPAAPRIDIEAGKHFWAFQPPERHAVPPVQHASWPRTPIDRFLLARLEQAGLEPSPPAERRTWIRRVSFDLVGLPPTPAEVEAFVNDRAPGAEERVVERLLASPHYGERWARLWLDVARYAEDQAHIVGNDQSLFYPNAYLYRDWVIRALNADMPYDRFVKLQLAADLIEPNDTTDLPALGFLGLGPKYYGRGSPAVMADEWEDRVDVVGRGLLGLTLACARCHDHKYDPIPTADYYALAGVFASTRMFNRPLDDRREKKANGEAKTPRDAMHIVCEGKAADLNIFVRGDVNTKGPIAPRHFVHVLCSGQPRLFHDGSGRRELAEAIASRDDPLTARVIVNRVWGQLFGRPIVGTPSNFGALGDRPTHPELLDDLAVRFMDAGWSLKWLEREIVLSAAYRQASRADVHEREADPENRLLGRMNRRRLTVECWRDAILAATGRLDLGHIGGPSIDPADPQERRRTVYSRISRLSLNPLLALFDYPDANLTAARRAETTTPLQKLFVMNSPFMIRQAEALAERVTKAVGGDDRAFIQRAYEVLYGRAATAAETRLGMEFLKRGERRQQYAHVLLAANEMLFLD
jgi:mono/diheme cytochrome c family protein